MASQANKNLINTNWNKLKCSPLGPFLQMVGLAPGNVNETSNLCKSSAFSSQFNSSMSEHTNMTKGLTGNMNKFQQTLNKIRNVIASMEQRAFQNLSNVATQLFGLYVKIGGLLFVIVKHLVNISNIFKATINFGASIAQLLIAMINVIRLPINFIARLV
jgi:hypothetical protein